MIRRLATFFAILVFAAVALPSFAQQPGSLVRFTGQLLDVRGGYVYFTTGDAFKLVPALRIADYDTGKPTTLQPAPKMWARAVLDPVTHDVVELDLTKRRLALDKSYGAVHVYAIEKSTPLPAPEIAGVLITGKEVPVTFIVEVPPTTPLNDDVYISTDSSQWNPQAIKMDRVDGQHYRVVRRFASGTKFAFKITRGSWNSVERLPNGLEPPAHQFFVHEIDAQVARVVVTNWSDDRPNGGQQEAQPGAIPTPFNQNPFPYGQGGLFPGSQATPPGGFPAPRPPNQPNRPPR